MKSLLFIMLLIAPAILISQNPNRQINKIYRSVERGEDVVKIGIPGFVARSAFNIARIIEKQDHKSTVRDTGNYSDADDLTLKELKPFVRAIRGVKILVVENENEIPVKRVKKSLKKLRNNQTVESLMQVRDGSTNVNIMIAEKKNKIRNIILLVKEEDQLVMLNLKMKLKAKKLGELVDMFQKQGAVGKIRDNIQI